MGLEDRLSPQTSSAPSSGPTPTKAEVEITKEIFRLLSHTVSSLKLFPSHHATIKKFIDELYARLEVYFESQPELVVDVREDSFLLGEEIIYKEEHLGKSLPYLFHKDGIKNFAILKGIDKAELHDLLDVIRKSSLLPFEESDVVIAIWEMDFSNIRIFAPDEYLLGKIDVFTRQPSDLFVDKGKLFGGQIELSADDLREIQTKSTSMGLLEQEESKNYAELITTLEDEDRDCIESILERSRQTPAEIEFHDMIFEVLRLEDRPERITPIMSFLERHHRDLIHESKFSFAVEFLKQIHELKNLFSDQHLEKAAELEKFLAHNLSGQIIDLILESIERGDFDSLPAFFDYLRFLGTKSVPLAARFFEDCQEPESRRAASAFLEEMAGDNIDALAQQLQDAKPAISKEIITLLGRFPSKKALSYLASLCTYTNREIKLAAVETLGSLSDLLAQKILLAFLQDRNEDIGEAAAGRLQWPGEASVLERVSRLVSSRSFHARGPKLKAATMNFLARTRTPEALTVLRIAMQKSGLFRRANREITRLCAVGALAQMGMPESSDILRRGLKSSNRKISDACRKALGSGPGNASAGSIQNL